MNLKLKNLLPLPLRDRLSARPSEVWQQDRDLRQGDWVFVRAPSGAGKTTLVHMLYGLRSDFTGEICWNGRDIKDQKTETLAQWRTQNISVIFQDLRVFPELTAWENLEVKRRLTNMVSEEECEDWLERLGIAHRKDKPAKTLSYGEQQRLVIIRALLQPFDWLLMDEPFSHLDQANTAKAIALISEVTTRNGAGLLLADLDDNQYFNYTQTLQL